MLERFAAKGVGIPYWFENIVKDTGLNNHVVNALCEEMADEGYLDKTQSEASLTSKGYVFFHSGGYLPITQEQIRNEMTAPIKKDAPAKFISLWRNLSANPVVKWIFGILTILLCAYLVYRFGWN